MMWGEIFKHKQIVAATFFSVVIVVGSYFLARSIQSPSLTQASEESALLQAIASRDSDDDGLADWEESLYGTDPHVADTFKLGVTDGEAVAKGLVVPKAIADIRIATSSATTFDSNGLPLPPAEGSLTAIFAQNFFTLFIAAKQAAGGADLTETQMSEVSAQALNSLASSITATPDYKSVKELVVSGSGPEALRVFAVSAEDVLTKNTSNATTTELNYLKAAIIQGDTTAYAHIASIAKGYRGSAAGLAKLPVPQELVTYDLDLINSMMRLSEITNDFTKADSDPLLAILALQQYETVITKLGKAFIGIGDAYAIAGITLPPSTPGASFVNMVSNVERAVTAAEKGKTL